MIVANPNHLKLMHGNYYPYAVRDNEIIHIRHSGDKNSVLCIKRELLGDGQIKLCLNNYYIKLITCPTCRHLYYLAQQKA